MYKCPQVIKNVKTARIIQISNGYWPYLTIGEFAKLSRAGNLSKTAKLSAFKVKIASKIMYVLPIEDPSNMLHAISVAADVNRLWPLQRKELHVGSLDMNAFFVKVPKKLNELCCSMNSRWNTEAKEMQGLQEQAPGRLIYE